MASKKDLVEAQAFSRRRLLTAFVSGAPGGRELEPTKPLRAVVAGVALSVLVVLGGLGLGLTKPSLPADWDDNRMVVVTETGSRFVAVQGTLYPVLNTASARLALSGALTAPVRLSADQIARTPRGWTIGIPGAPDELPTPDGLVDDGWLSCVAPDGALTTVLSESAETAAVTAGIQASATDGGPSTGLLVKVADRRYLVAEGRYFAIPGEHEDAVLRALGMESAQPWAVPATWLNLFTPGADLAPVQVPGAGQPLDDPAGAPEGAVVGAVVHVTDADRSYVITDQGRLAPLSDLALAMYKAGGVELPLLEATFTATSAMRIEDTPLAPADWPIVAPELVSVESAACAQLSTEDVAAGSPTPVRLAAAPVAPPADGVSEVRVDPGAGALVRPVAGTVAAGGVLQLVDHTGTAFALPGADADVLARLGYAVEDVTAVPQAWLALLDVGPELTVDAAQQPYVPSTEASTEASADGIVVPTPEPTPEPSPGDGTAPAAQQQGCNKEEPEYVGMAPPALARMGADAAWGLATGEGVIVAVVDSGVDRRNVHLGDVVLEGADLIAPDGDPRGWTDPAGHGTAIAGIIAGQRYEADGIASGVQGLAPDARILPVRVYVDRDEQTREQGLGPTAEGIAAGIRYATDHGAQIINVSMSTVHENAELADAVRYATAHGSLVVASAGNRETSEDTADSPRYPAAFDDALAVTAVGDLDQGVDASIHGSHVEVAAPGTNVVTAYLDKGDCLLGGEGSPSFATAYVSAAAALVAQRFPTETPQQWAYRLTATASRPQADRRDDVIGWGVVRPWAALTFVDDGTAPGPPSPMHPATRPTAAPLPPVSSTVRTDALAPVRSDAVWWAFGGVAALAGALLASFPGLRRRRRRP